MSLRLPITFNTALDTYTATEIIGEGGSSRIFKATDASGETVAIKLLNPTKLSSENLKRFKNEILFCIKNKHPNIVTILDHGIMFSSNISIPFSVMSYYSSSLRRLIQAGITPERVLPYFSQILDGIEAAHLQKVIHRDIKPENILYDKDKNIFVIADFGIAQFREEELFTAVKTADTKRLANFQYAAPEQKERGKQVDHRADIFALGLILNEMFTKQVPQGTSYKTIGSVFKDYAYLDDLVNEMLKQSYEERPSSIEIIKRELTRRGNEFITNQKVSQLNNTVIPVSDIDDPIVKAPIRIVSMDWNDNVLSIVLSQRINAKWLQAFHNMGSHSSLLGKGPEAFDFRGDIAIIPAQEREVQDIIIYFKGWLPQVNTVYERNLKEEMRKNEEARRKKIEQERKIQEARQRILKNTKI